MKKSIFKELHDESKAQLERSKASLQSSASGETACQDKAVSFTELMSFVQEISGCFSNADAQFTLLPCYRCIIDSVKDGMTQSDVQITDAASPTTFDMALAVVNAVDAVVAPEWVQLLSEFCDQVDGGSDDEETDLVMLHKDSMKAIFFNPETETHNMTQMLNVVNMRAKFTFQAMHEITWTTLAASKFILATIGKPVWVELSSKDSLIKPARYFVFFRLSN